ncbi:hypothetical protein, partial [Pseudoneobacillus sp. C159]
LTRARALPVPAAGVPQPIACLPDRFAIVTEEASGLPLQRLLKQLCVVRTSGSVTATLRALYRVGRWVRHFQETVPILDRPSNLRRYLDVRL